MANDLRFPISKMSFAGYLFATLEAICAVALLATSAYLISRASEQPPILYLMVAVVGVRAFALGRATFRYLQRLALHSAVFHNLGQVRPKLFQKLVQLVPGGIQHRAQSLERFTSDVDRLQDGPLRVLTPLLQATAATAAMLAIALLIHPLVALALMLTSVFFAVAALLLAAKAGKQFEMDRIFAAQQLREELHRLLSQIDINNSYGWTQSLREDIQKSQDQLLRLDRRRTLPLASSGAILSLGSVITAVLGGWLAAVNSAEISPVTIAVLVLMPLSVFDVYSQLPAVVSAFQGYKSSKQRLQQLLDRDIAAELMVPEGDRQLQSVKEIELEELSVARGGKQVLTSLSLSLTAGYLAAVCGPSGSGKTSLALVISSLVAPSSGEMRINGIPSGDYSLESRRRQIILIEQDPHLFRGSLRQNLEISGELSDSKMLEALDAVGLKAEFEQRGLLDAQIHEDSSNVSGGQAQRIAIARGLLAGASVLILDEPSSGLDRKNALELFSLLHRLAKSGMIVVAVTHDQELANSCDQQLSLDVLRH
ncbi:MAG: hypothetical protein RI929_419 [Actinomycetota bacterium]